MSTCPDSDLFSAFADGEVPSPWKEKLEAHINACPTCRHRTLRYSAQHALFQTGLPTLTEERLEASFSRLSAKRSSLLMTLKDKPNNPYLAWAQSSVKIPVTALAAMLLVAIFFPVYFTLKNTQSQHQAQSGLTILPGESTINTNISQKMKALSTSTPVYSPDLLTYISTKSLLTTNRNQLFTIISFASNFSSAKDLFSDAEIVIIKLPALTQFNNTGEDLFSTDENLMQASGFYK